MKIKALGEYILLKEEQKKSGLYTGSNGTAKVIDVGGYVGENIEVGDIVYFNKEKSIKIKDELLAINFEEIYAVEK
jgi:co-chaperonin GroES (HSP10)